MPGLRHAHTLQQLQYEGYLSFLERYSSNLVHCWFYVDHVVLGFDFSCFLVGFNKYSPGGEY